MSTTDIIAAFEAGLITRGEAVEQGLVETLDALYEKTAGRPGWRGEAQRSTAQRAMGR